MRRTLALVHTALEQHIAHSNAHIEQGLSYTSSTRESCVVCAVGEALPSLYNVLSACSGLSERSTHAMTVREARES